MVSAISLAFTHARHDSQGLKKRFFLFFLAWILITGTRAAMRAGPKFGDHESRALMDLQPRKEEK